MRSILRAAENFTLFRCLPIFLLSLSILPEAADIP